MDKIEWSDKLNIGIEELDQQHKTIINYFNDIFDVVEAKQAEVMEKKFDALLEYLGVHFTYEEELMKKSEYPEYAKHKAEHDEMRKKMFNIKSLYSGGVGEVVCSIKGLFCLWLDDHKKNTDNKFGVYARSKGIT